MKLKHILLVAMLVVLVVPVMATSYTTVTSTIIGKTPSGLLIDLHIEDYVSVEQALMYYNYIAIFFIVLWAAFASQTNESRYTFTTPFMAALMVFIGWLNAGTNSTNYWGTIMFCLLLGAFMYLNDMNHEKYGLPGVGDKLITVAFMIMCFTASYGFITSSQFGWFNEASSGTTANVMCGSAYQCDSAGNIDLGSSVTTISSSGGLVETLISDAAILLTIAISILKLIIIVVGSVLLFGGVILAAYPALAASPQAVAFLVVMNLVIWAIYIMAFFRWYYKPGIGDGQI